MNTIFRGFAKQINVVVRLSSGPQKGDPVDLTLATEIKACIADQDALLTTTGITVTDAKLGKFDIDFTAVQMAVANLDLGNDTVDGFIQFPAGTDPIPYEIVVEVEDLPCPP